MQNIDDFLNTVAKNTKGNDNKIAVYLGINNAHVGNWRGRRSMPSNKHVIALCNLAGISLAEAILAIEHSREFERPLKETGFVTFGTMAGLSAMSIIGVSLLSSNPSLVQSFAGLHCILC